AYGERRLRRRAPPGRHPAHRRHHALDHQQRREGHHDQVHGIRPDPERPEPGILRRLAALGTLGRHDAKRPTALRRGPLKAQGLMRPLRYPLGLAAGVAAGFSAGLAAAGWVAGAAPAAGAAVPDAPLAAASPASPPPWIRFTVLSRPLNWATNS